MTIKTPKKDKIKAIRKVGFMWLWKKKTLIKVTKIGAVFAIKVAWATEVKYIDQFHKAISIPKLIPANINKSHELLSKFNLRLNLDWNN